MRHARDRATGLWLQGERLKLRGEVSCYLDGELAYRGPNYFTQNGYAMVGAWLSGQSSVAYTGAGSYTASLAPPLYIAVGTGAGTPAATDYDMFAELARKACDTITFTGYIPSWQATFSISEANGALTEIGLGSAPGYPNGVNGTASAYSTTTLTDSGAAWTTNQWAGCTLHVVSATTGAPRKATITSNTGTVLTFPAITLPTGTVTYRVEQPVLYAHAAISLTKTTANSLIVAWRITPGL